ncbi:MAG: class I SAM-dependent methyltransferase [Ginsengibacter sp.]
MQSKTNTTRFSDRIDDYVKYRPLYPQQLIEILKNKIAFNNSFVIADIGSGTGISSQLFISNGNKVYGVEPNKQMREAAELFFLKEKNFITIDGTAEKTTLQENSIDIIFCGQAFHWFNRNLARIEFERILKDDGHIVLAWNVRKQDDDFQKEYEKMLQQIPGYNEVNHKNISDEIIKDFFSPRIMHKESVENSQVFNLKGLKGRLQSSSYFPKSGIEHEDLMKKTESIFYKYEKNNTIKFLYETNMYWC